MKLALLLGVLFPAVSFAATFSLTLPTQYDDGTPLAESEITAVIVQYGNCILSGQGIGTVTGSIVLDGIVKTQGQLPPLPSGTYCLRAFARVGLGAQIVDGDFSDVAQLKIPPKRAGKPTNFRVTP